MSLLLILLFSILFNNLSNSSGLSSQPGICYGQLGNNLPAPSKSISLIKSLNAKRIKLYDTNPQILTSLKNTNLQVSIMLPNELITNISTNQTLSDQWIKSNILPFYPQTLIRYILVGNEIISSTPNTTWPHLVPAMRRIKHSLKKLRIKKIKVDVYPFFPWSSDPVNINLDYALFRGDNVNVTDPGSGLVYTNLFDQMVDSVYFAMEKLGFPDIRIFIAETGWPNGGDIDQIGANVFNAATYNRNFVKKVMRKPVVGTPARPGSVLPSFLFALFNENQKPGPGTERHFGLLYPNGSRVYEIDLSGETPESEFPVLPPPENNEPYKGKIWCVVARGSNVTALGEALAYACSQGNQTCDPVRPGRECFKPDSVFWHASYAFSSYWAQFKKIGGTCYFNGLAIQTAKDPSYGSCKFPSVTL
ncbi:unnamed protein product [Vicia faba]|uniref:glucan endo-1,3-beta-D-glucosidase n=1 Tax=Vicia faba TaxID=3906 RepID=A0AAV1AS00_VICFA|nr:unnamed protein product [Vicia faba]